MAAQLLLVDDEPGLREAVKDYLQESGFSVQVASNAREGWELVQQNTPDLVISDIMMPQVDGYQFLKQLRDDPRFRLLPVIFLTAKGMTTDRIQGYQAGVDAYLPKPFDPDELVAIVENLLERRTARIPTPTEEGEALNITELANQIAQIKALLTQKNAIAQSPAPFAIDLTPREQSVLNLVAEGLMNKEIARRLETSVRNVEKYVSRLFSKTGTNSRTELVRFALEHGLAK
ncbi:MAG: response regulator transcription factor [Brasilonema sp.]